MDSDDVKVDVAAKGMGSCDFVELVALEVWVKTS